MTAKKITRWVIWTGVILWAGWDIVPALNHIEGDTISEIIRNKSREHLVIPFLFGFLCAHWFWVPNALTKEQQKEREK